MPVAPSFRQAFRFWLKLGFINFGGPAGQIALMHRELVDRRGWLGEEQFLRALNFCMLLPGPEAQQLATYAGWRLHGTRGGLCAGILFVAPSIVVMLLLSWLAAAHHDVPVIAGLLYGVQPVVVALVAEALLRVGKRAIHHHALWWVAAAAFVALHLRLPFPLVVAGAGALGLALARRYPHVFRKAGAAPPPPPPPEGGPRPGAGRALRVAAAFAAPWAVFVGALWLWRGGADVLVREALFFTKAAFVTFGGAY
ncbi:MAG: chromate transporter, partial [Myxococcota bacterium]